MSAADANRYFSRILQDVKDGETVVVTSRGQPVARIMPADTGECAKAEAQEAEREQAWQEHLARLSAQPPLNLGTITRDEIYDE